jgi:predicted ATP-dependent protease
MATNAAKEGELGKLHSKVARVMQNALDVQDEAQVRYLDNPEAIEVPQVNASLLSVITKFLADNSITAAPDDSEHMSELEEKIKERQRKRSINNIIPFENVG